MNVEKSEVVKLQIEQDIVICRQRARILATELKFSLVDQTKLVTAVSEIARNTLIHGGGGSALFEVLAKGARYGLRITFEDHGPGIANIQQAMSDGFSTGGGLGLGLGGAKRLSNDFEIVSRVGEGTRVILTRWK